ncbi:MAG: hypothetical protein KGM24_04180 [Elusimicrobia bacterium]|nr:hypothetical protein [Elusimicrobiota bacterium]
MSRRFARLAVLSAVLLPLPALAQGEAPAASPSDAAASGLITPSIPSVPKIFLPDLGIAGDLAYERSSLPKTDPRWRASDQQPRLRDGQIIAYSPIDPYTNAQLSVDLPEDGVANVEEAWLYFDKLPWGLAARVGKFKPVFGLLDETDTFQLPMLDRPRAVADFLGDGLNATGAQLGFYVPNPWGWNLKADLAASRGDTLGSARATTDLAYLATLDYSGDFLTAGSVEAGVSAAQGPSPYGRSEELENPYLKLQYAPSQRRVWTWSVEGMFAQRRGLGRDDARNSAWTFLDYNFALRYHAGLLVDYVQVPGALPTAYPGTFPDAFTGAPSAGRSLSVAPNFTWFVSDNMRLRAQFTHTTPLGAERPDETGSLQATFSLGNLKQLD